MKCNVGDLRFQSALIGADALVEVTSEDPEVAEILRQFVVETMYPDTVNSDGKLKRVFKVCLKRKP